MKKVLTLLLFIGSGLSYGEELKFVTYLSSPVGTFSQLETADPAAPLVMTGDSQEVNFCNTRVNTGSVNIRSAAGAVLNRLNLSNGTSLKGSVPDYRLSSSLTLNRGGSLTAKRILGTTAAYESSSIHKSKVNNTLYITSAGTVKGAKTESLTIPNKATTGTNGTGTTGVELWWDNQYTRDYTSAGVATGSKTYDSYLLKSKSAVEEETEDCSTNFVVNDTCCEWVWKQGTGAANFGRCWKKAVSHIYQVKEVWALHNVCYSSSCQCYGNNISYCTYEPTKTSGTCPVRTDTVTPCTMSVVQRCQYFSASEASAAGVFTGEGYYDRVNQRQCVEVADCRDTSHMIFPEPGKPACYVRV